MKVTLRPYASTDAEALVPFLTAFWAVHHTRVDAEEARQELSDWSAGRHRLYVIEADGAAAGFLHLNRRGPVAAWVEDLFVAEPLRRRGIAGEAIRQAEALVRADGVEALCMDVAADNVPALRLYHRLGFDRLSLITVRKDFEPFETARVERLGGVDFRVKQF